MSASNMAMQHLSEDDLVLHYYGEMSDAEDARVATHLGECGACHAGYTRLQRVLAAVDALPAPELPEGFERTTWARLEPAIAAPRRGTLRWFLAPSRLAWSAAVMALVAAAFVAGRVTRSGPTGPEPAAQSAEQVRERILLVDLGDHLDRSQMVLVELVSAETGAELDVERARAEQLLGANRLYRQTAKAAGDAGVTQLLDELERVLVDVAAGPDSTSSQEMDQVRRRIEGGLLFKVRIVSSEVRERQHAAQQQRGT
jgi:anti-sigma factor RsiW